MLTCPFGFRRTRPESTRTATAWRLSTSMPTATLCAWSFGMSRPSATFGRPATTAALWLPPRTASWSFASTSRTRQPWIKPLERFVDLGGLGTRCETCANGVMQWKKKVELHCGGPPIILVGLKQDLRTGYPTLKLLHLDEPDSTTLGQVCPPLFLLNIPSHDPPRN